MVPHRLTLLGHPCLTGPDGERIHLRTRKHLALLIWLAVEPSRPYRRDRLAALLWPKSTMSEARHSLTTALSVLRGKLGGSAFDASRETVRLVPGHVDTDIALLEHENPLEASEIPVGSFLDEFEIPDSPGFQQWLDIERARVISVLHHHLSHRIDQCRHVGDTDRMRTLARRLQKIDPLSECAARALLESLAMSGERLGALRGYDAWCTRLLEEVRAVPPQDLEKTAARLRRNGVCLQGRRTSAAVSTSRWSNRPFVGRRDEHAIGYGVWQHARSGESAHLLISGESGIGKTHLVDRLSATIALEGGQVVRVQCNELERELPFGVIGTLVAQLLDLAGASATPAAQLAELATVSSTVHMRWPHLPVPSHHTGESARIQFTEAVMSLLTAVTDDQPVVLLVDDLHLADAASLAVLHHIIRRVAHQPLMAVLTTVVGYEVAPTSVRTFVDASIARRVTQVALTTLSERHSSQLLDALLGSSPHPGPTVRKALLGGARGNPMLIELLLADWQRQAAASLVFTIPSMTLQTEERPRDALPRLVTDMLQSLEEDCRSVAHLAAILGHRLNDLALYELVDLPVTRTMRALSTLATHRVLRDTGTRLEFSNEIIRAQCYVGMPASLRQTLHSMVADRLLHEKGVGAMVHGLEVAWHLVRGDRLPEAVPFLLEGGRDSIHRGAPHEADLALSTGLPALLGIARRQAILLLAEALQELGRWRESLQVLEMDDGTFGGEEEDARRILQLGAQIADGGCDTPTQAHPVDWLVETIYRASRVENKLRASTVALAWLNRCRDPGRTRALQAALDTIAPSTLPPLIELHYRLARAWTACNLGDWSSGLEHLGYGARLAERHGWASSLVVRLLIGQSNTLSNLGRYGEALPIAEAAFRHARRLDNQALLSSAAGQLAMIAGRQGNAKAQVYWADVGLEQVDREAMTPHTLGLLYELGVGYALRGETSKALSTCDRLSLNRPERGEQWMAQASLLCRADILALSGQRGNALALARHATAGRLRDPAFAGLFARWTALRALQEKSTEQALRRLSRTLQRVEGLHAKDQVEVNASIALLKSSSGIDASAEWSRVAMGLEKLPAGIPALMGRFGFLQESESWTSRRAN